MNPDLVPAVDAAGLPGPVWLFQVLLVVTFFLHLLFVNITLGGSLLAWVAHLRSGGSTDDPRGTLAARLTAVNGYGISLTITTGVAPLLFIQTLYQQYFYTGTILVGGLWFALLVLLLVGYYTAYLYKFRGAPATGRGGGLWIAVSALSFLLIAVVHVVVHLVHVQPTRWASFEADPWSVVADPTFVPRLLHFVLAGLGFAAVVLVWWSIRAVERGGDRQLEGAIARFGWKWVLWTTVLQVVDGFVLLVVLPQPVLSGLMKGGVATMVPLTLAIVGAVGLLVMIARVSDPLAAKGTVTGTLGAMVVVIALMTVTRHQIRVLYLAPTTDLGAFTITAQWLNIGLFVVLLVGALATVYVMVKKVFANPATGADAA
jgi:hypothetical protein